MKKSYTITIAILMIIAVLYTVYFKQSKPKPLIIGMMNGWAPFMTINKHGDMEGFDVDIVKEIEKVINQPIVIKDLGSLAALFIALEQGSVDAILSGLDVTEKRKREYDFVIYENNTTRLNKYCCVTGNTGPENESDLKRKSYVIGVESGLSWESTLDKYTLLERRYLSSITDMVLQLEQNKIDCFIFDPTQCNRLKLVIPDLNYFVLDIDSSIGIDGIGIFIKKNNIKLKNILQEAVDILFKNKIIEDLVKKWNLA